LVVAAAVDELEQLRMDRLSEFVVAEASHSQKKTEVVAVLPPTKKMGRLSEAAAEAPAALQKNYQMDCLLALFAVASDHQKVPQKDLLEPVAPSSFIFVRRKTSLGPT
jgi:hypothetical protein